MDQRYDEMVREQRARYPHVFSPIFDDFGFEIGPGWSGIVDHALDRIKGEYPEARVDRIKEKFGTLRIHAGFQAPDGLKAIIAEAEEISSRTCEICGGAGEMIVHGGPRRVRCRDHVDL